MNLDYDIYSHCSSGDKTKLEKSVSSSSSLTTISLTTSSLSYLARTLSSSSISSLHRSGSNVTITLHRSCKILSKDHAGWLITIINIDGNTSIHEAYVYNNVSCGRILLEAKADINTIDNDGNSSLTITP